MSSRQARSRSAGGGRRWPSPCSRRTIRPGRSPIPHVRPGSWRRCSPAPCRGWIPTMNSRPHRCAWLIPARPRQRRTRSGRWSHSGPPCSLPPLVGYAVPAAGVLVAPGAGVPTLLDPPVAGPVAPEGGVVAVQRGEQGRESQPGGIPGGGRGPHDGEATRARTAGLASSPPGS